MKLIVGLGNPGPRYAATRHNVGWRVAEELAARVGAASWREKCEAAVAEGRSRGGKVVLARPMTYMNESGRSVRQLVDFWKIEREDVLMVVDDMAIDLGRLRLRAEGSDGGHNGLASIIAHLGHDCFARLRVGIGPAPARTEDHAAFVLAEFRPEERPVVADTVRRAADAAECWMTEGLVQAMNRFNPAAKDA